MRTYSIGAHSIRVVFSSRTSKLVGLLFAVVASYCAYDCFVQYILECKVKAPNLASQCTLELRLYDYTLADYPLGTLNYAELARSNINRHRASGARVTINNLYFINLVYSAGSMNLTGYSSILTTNKDRAINSINQYIINSLEPIFVIDYPTDLWEYGLTLVLAFIALSGLTCRTILIEVDQRSQTVSIRKKSLIFPQFRVIPFKDIELVTTLGTLETKSRQYIRYFRLAFILKNAKRVVITPCDTAKGSVLSLAKELNKFIKMEALYS